jgi:hypothetical protein
MELDLFLPHLSLAFEYQGEQHYKPNSILGNQDFSVRDEEKKRMSKDIGITLIEVPYWWNKLADSLVSLDKLYYTKTRFYWRFQWITKSQPFGSL